MVVNKVKHADFGRRLTQVADQHPHCPPVHEGRLRWLSDRMKQKGRPVSGETCRKWFAGESRPTEDNLYAIAEIMTADAEWLSRGNTVRKSVPAFRPPAPRPAPKMSPEMAIVAALIEMDGGMAAPDGNGLLAIIDGMSYRYRVVVGLTQGRDAVFKVPAHDDGVRVIGLIREGTAFDMFDITGHRGDISLPGDKLVRIESFATIS